MFDITDDERIEVEKDIKVRSSILHFSSYLYTNESNHTFADNAFIDWALCKLGKNGDRYASMGLPLSSRFWQVLFRIILVDK